MESKTMNHTKKLFAAIALLMVSLGQVQGTIAAQPEKKSTAPKIMNALKKTVGTIAGGVGLAGGGYISYLILIDIIRRHDYNLTTFGAGILGLYAIIGGYHIMQATWKSNPSNKITEQPKTV
jgi:hypothetical protein